MTRLTPPRRLRLLPFSSFPVSPPPILSFLFLSFVGGCWWLLVEAGVRWQLAVVWQALVVVPVEWCARVRRVELGVHVDRRWTEVVPLSQGTRLALGA